MPKHIIRYCFVWPNTSRQNHIAVIFISAEMGGEITVASHGDSMIFIENNSRYRGLQLKVIVSRTGLKAWLAADR